MSGPAYPPDSVDDAYMGFDGRCHACGCSKRSYGDHCRCTDLAREQEERDYIAEVMLGQDIEWNAGVTRGE